MTELNTTDTVELFAAVQKAFDGRFDLDQLIASSEIRALFLVRDIFLKRRVALRIHFEEGNRGVDERRAGAERRDDSRHPYNPGGQRRGTGRPEDETRRRTIERREGGDRRAVG